MAVATVDLAMAAVYPVSFGVEIGTQRNGDVILQCLPGQRQRCVCLIYPPRK